MEEAGMLLITTLAVQDEDILSQSPLMSRYPPAPVVRRQVGMFSRPLEWLNCTVPDMRENSGQSLKGTISFPPRKSNLYWLEPASCVHSTPVPSRVYRWPGVP